MGSVRKKGDRWYFSVELPTENGKRKRVERAGGKTKKEALEKMKVFEVEVLKFGYKEESKMRFEELANIWIEKYSKMNCKDSTVELYERVIRLHLLPKLGNYKVVDIRPTVINDFYNSLKIEDYKYSMAHLTKNILNSCLNFAVFPMEIINSNPCNSVKFPKFEKSLEEKTIVSRNDLELILEKGAKYYNFNEMCMFLYNTGLRISEALALQWEDIDFKEKIIHIRHNVNSKNKREYELTTPKTRNSVRDIFFNEDVEQVFKSLKKKQSESRIKYGKYYIKLKHNFIFTSKEGNILTRNTFANKAKTLSERGCNKFTMHTFRHTHATMLLQAGANMKDVQARLGHSDISTTMNIYVQATEESKKDALKKFDEYIKTSNI